MCIPDRSELAKTDRSEIDLTNMMSEVGGNLLNIAGTEIGITIVSKIALCEMMIGRLIDCGGWFNWESTNFWTNEGGYIFELRFIADDGIIISELFKLFASGYKNHFRSLQTCSNAPHIAWQYQNVERYITISYAYLLAHIIPSHACIPHKATFSCFLMLIS